MQTVSFQCGHCGKVMGVGAQFLGQQVRCPHCQGVVLAPTGPPPAPAPAPVLPNLGPTVEHRPDHEDIFTQPESDDLFGGEPAPRVEIPPGPTMEAPRALLDPAGLLKPPDDDATLNLPGQQAPLFPEPEPTVQYSPPAAGQATVAATPAPVNEGAFGTVGGALGDAAELPTPAVRRTPQGGKGFPTLLIVLPLVSYAVIISVVAFLLYRDREAWKQLPRNELDKLPDLDGDAPGVTRDKRQGLIWDRKECDWLYTKPIPPHLRASLGVPLVVGNLEVTPTRFERKKVGVRVENQRPDQMAAVMDHESLVVHLRLRNLSKDQTFAPLDPYFDRGWESTRKPPAPLTLLEVGDQKFYGSSSDWYPLDRSVKDKRQYNRSWVVGRQNEPELLRPGGVLETFVSTDGRDARVARALADLSGPAVYRVHLRIGLVENKGREVPATAIIGIEIDPKDIHRGEDDKP
jgi:hypothetical protein